MKNTSRLSHTISVAGARAMYDAEAKKHIADPQILSRILAECVDEYRGLTPDEISEKYLQQVNSEIPGDGVHRDIMLSNEDTSINEGTVRYDMLFHLEVPSGDTAIKVYVNLEAQNTFGPDIPRRAMYYASRILSSQYGKTFSRAEYDKLERVYSIWICTSVPAILRNTVQIFRMQSEGKVADKVIRYYNGIDLERIVFVNTGFRSNVKDITALLGTLLDKEIGIERKKNRLSLEFGIKMTGELERGLDDMCNLSEGIFEKGMEKGIEKGMEKGRTESVLNSIRALMDNLDIPAEKAMDLLSISEKERTEFLAKLE